ncbi:MAG: 1-acyl-sn-glycerol-3-phosphate acyltransferase [Actinobacteria bacterium]|nr:MAG: 1-acyl-sn-glycerol-3-phosphate acyltransferase [Actinomycetota bacterium]
MRCGFCPSCCGHSSIGVPPFTECCAVYATRGRTKSAKSGNIKVPHTPNKLVTGGRIDRIDEGGARFLQGTDPVIIAPNHLGHGDGGIVAMSLPLARRLRLRLIADHHAISLWSGAPDWRTRAWHRLLLTLTIKSYDAIVVRGELRSSAAVAAMAGALQRGDTVLIFPEGDFGTAEELKPLRPGVARLAIQTGATIVPVRIDGTADAMPTVRRLRTRPQVVARFRPPVVALPGETEDQLLSRLAATLSPDPQMRSALNSSGPAPRTGAAPGRR